MEQLPSEIALKMNINITSPRHNAAKKSAVVGQSHQIYLGNYFGQKKKDTRRKCESTRMFSIKEPSYIAENRRLRFFKI